MTQIPRETLEKAIKDDHKFLVVHIPRIQNKNTVMFCVKPGDDPIIYIGNPDRYRPIDQAVRIQGEWIPSANCFESAADALEVFTIKASECLAKIPS